ncbi:hypothetical protein KAW48_05195 [candidate division WOR-3 bacterium]|nr:hypothetical protein [candidate division WOR-3 bacterium]
MKKIQEIESGLVDIKKVDKRGRITISKSLEKLPDEVEEFEIYVKNGEIILKPLIRIPAREAWLFKDKSALNSLLKGLADMKRGELTEIDKLDKFLKEL